MPLSQSTIRSWARQFRQGKFTVEDVQDRFAELSEAEIASLQADLREAIKRARQELDAIRYGMCEPGQRGELQRILAELEGVMDRSVASQRTTI